MRRRSAPLRAWRLTRSGTLDPNPMGFITTAGIFASTVPAGSILLTTRLDTGLAHYLITPDTGNASQSALHLARAVAARADEVDRLPTLDNVEKVVWMTTEKWPALISRDTQSGTYPAAVARALAISLRPRQWVAAAVRAPTPKERRWALTWLESQMNTANPRDHLRRSEALVATFYAGAETVEEAEQLLRETGAAMPGFDIATSHSHTSRMKDARGWFGSAGAQGLAGVGSRDGGRVGAPRHDTVRGVRGCSGSCRCRQRSR